MGLTNNNQCQASKHISLSKIKNRDSKIHQQSTLSRMLYGFNLPEGHILSCAHPYRIAKVSVSTSTIPVLTYSPLFLCLPFRIAIASQVFTTIVEGIAAHTVCIREKQDLFIPYIDNFLPEGDSQDLVLTQISSTLKIPEELGWIVNWEKCMLIVSQIQT